MKLGTPPSRRIIGALLLGAALRTRSSDAFVGDRPISATTAAAAAAAAAGTAARTTPTSLGMVRNRGLERRVEGATPMRELSRARFFCLVAFVAPAVRGVGCVTSIPPPSRRFDLHFIDIIMIRLTKSLSRPAPPPKKKSLWKNKKKTNDCA